MFVNKESTILNLAKFAFFKVSWGIFVIGCNCFAGDINRQNFIRKIIPFRYFTSERSAVQCSAVQCSAVQCSAVQDRAVPCKQYCVDNVLFTVFVPPKRQLLK